MDTLYVASTPHNDFLALFIHEPDYLLNAYFSIAASWKSYVLRARNIGDLKNMV